ncbi:MAG: hypothetical protein AAGG47_09500 [Pseudomonadota bacterium]
MTFAIVRHAETIAQHHQSGPVPAPPPPVVVTESAISSRDFAFLDLGRGDAVGLTLHRVPGVLPERLSRLQIRLDGGEPIDLAQPATAGTQVIEGFVPGVSRTVEIRTVEIDPATGVSLPAPWSPAQSVTTTAFSASSYLSDTVDPVTNASDAWIGTNWGGALDSGGYARFTSGTATQTLPAALLPAAGESMLFIAELRSDGAASTGLRVTLDLDGGGGGGGSAVAEAVIDWSDGSVATSGSSGMAAVQATRISFNGGSDTARLALEFTLPAGSIAAATAEITGANSAFRGADLRAWIFGDSAWPAAETWEGPSGVRRLVPPETSDFGFDTFQLGADAPWGVASTVFGDEEASSAISSARTNTLTGASVTAGGSGYADGSYVVAVEGGKLGRVQVVASGGSIVSASIVEAGREYIDEPVVPLEGIGGGAGAVVTVTRGKTLRDFWPSVNEGRTRASWDGRVLGQDGFAVEGFLMDGQFWPADSDHLMPSGVILRVNANGTWSAKANGTTEFEGLGEGFLVHLALVIGNGGTRSLIDLPIGFGGSGLRKMRIVMAPRLTGSARLGERLRVLPGSVELEEGFVPSLQYLWMVDGEILFGETEETLLLTHNKVPVGSAVQCRVRWDGAGANEYWDTSARIVGDWKVVADGDEVSFGALTPPGIRGIPIARPGRNINSGDPLGHWEIHDVDGISYLRPAVGPSTPGSDPKQSGEAVISGSYSLSISGGQSLTVNVVPDSMTLGTRADLALVAQDVASPLGQGLYGFDFASGMELVLWNSGDWGGVDDIAVPESRIEDLVLVGTDADGGTGQVRVLPYDASEGAAVTAPLHFAGARNLSWEVDLDHAEQPVVAARSPRFIDGALVKIDEVGRTVAFRDCRIQGAFLMAERLRGPRDPGGVVLGGGATQMAGSGAAQFLFDRVEIADTGAVTTSDFGAVTMRDCRVHRVGVRPFRLGTEVSSLTLNRVLVHDAVAATPFDAGAWISFLPDGATGYAPIYRPGVPITIEDSALWPGQSRLPALNGIRLNTDAALPTGGESAFGFVYSDVIVRRSLIMGGGASALLLSSGDAGEITDSGFYVDARNAGLAEAEVSHANGFRPLDGSFSVTRSILGVDTLGSGIARSDAVALTAAGYDAAFEGEGSFAFAPRSQTQLFAAFTPSNGGVADLGADTAGPIDAAGAFKGDLSAIPGISTVDWGVPSWGVDMLLTGVGWGAIPFAAEAFAIVASKLSGPAPLFVTFEVAGVTDDNRRDDTFTWDFGEDYAYTSFPENHQVKGTAGTGLGPATCHAALALGTRTITLRQRNRAGVDRTTSMELEVLDPDDWFAGPKTMVLNPEGDSDFTGAPADAILLEADAVGIQAAFDHVGISSRRLLFKAGGQYAMGDTFGRIARGTHVTTYGGTERAILLEDGFPSLTTSVFELVPGDNTNTVIANFEFEGSWDPANPGPGQSSRGMVNTQSRFGTLLLNNWMKGCAGFGATGEVGYINCRLRNWRSYGMFAQAEGRPLYCRGVSFIQDESLLDRDWRELLGTGFSQGWGAVRNINNNLTVFDQCFTQHYPGGRPIQPTFRLMAAGGAVGTRATQITRSDLLGAGAAILNIGFGSFNNKNGEAVLTRYILIDSNVLTMHRASNAIFCEHPAFQIRNNIIRTPTDRVSGSQQFKISEFLQQGATSGRYNQLIDPPNSERGCWFHYNTIMIDMDYEEPGSNNAALFDIASDLTDIFYPMLSRENNAMRIHPRHPRATPSLDPGVDDDGRLYTTSSFQPEDLPEAPILDIEGTVRSGATMPGAFHMPGTTPAPGAVADTSDGVLAAYFSPPDAGGLWLFDDFAHLWQDSAGTVPVTQDGDPIRRVDDVSGNDNHMIYDGTVGLVARVLPGGKICVEADVDNVDGVLLSPENGRSIGDNTSWGLFVVSEETPWFDSRSQSNFFRAFTRVTNGRAINFTTRHRVGVVGNGQDIDLRVGSTNESASHPKQVSMAVSDGSVVRAWRASLFGDEQEAFVQNGENSPDLENEGGLIQFAAGLESNSTRSQQRRFFGIMAVQSELTEADRLTIRNTLSSRFRTF